MNRRIDDIHFHWRRSDREAFPKLFYGIAIFENEKDDIQRKFDQLENNKTPKCKTDGLLQFGTAATNKNMKQLVNSDGEFHLYIEKDFFHFSPQVRDSHLMRMHTQLYNWSSDESRSSLMWTKCSEVPIYLISIKPMSMTFNPVCAMVESKMTRHVSTTDKVFMKMFAFYSITQIFRMFLIPPPVKAI